MKLKIGLTAERIYYAILRLFRFLFIITPVIYFPVKWGYHWIAYIAVIMGFITAVFYHQSEEQYGYLNGRISTDICISGITCLPLSLKDKLINIHPDLFPAFTVGSVFLALYTWVSFYKLERESITYAKRISTFAVLINPQLWSSVFLILFFYFIYQIIFGENK